ncbi:hypothetical protein HGRIS_012299 [Hohenbuehelia grisea]|uniref:Uncharacterized protein n=1 Tax=Hohenbuehelia grisea TaxID=104357 RepID=A0ABR3IRS9_9AGAR
MASIQQKLCDIVRAISMTAAAAAEWLRPSKNKTGSSQSSTSGWRTGSPTFMPAFTTRRRYSYLIDVPAIKSWREHVYHAESRERGAGAESGVCASEHIERPDARDSATELKSSSE